MSDMNNPALREPAVNEFEDCREFLHKILTSAPRLYAVIDSAQDASLARSAWFDYGFETWSLFGENVDASMSSVAPQLVAVDSGKNGRQFLDAWADQLWTNAGVLIVSTTDSRTVWKHLADLFVVSDSDERLMYFRFYDPRILRSLMPTLRGEQIREVFGPIQEYVIEDEPRGAVVRCRSNREEIHFDRWRLKS